MVASILPLQVVDRASVHALRDLPAPEQHRPGEYDIMAVKLAQHAAVVVPPLSEKAAADAHGGNDPGAGWAIGADPLQRALTRRLSKP